jgi:hypothetical protein
MCRKGGVSKCTTLTSLKYDSRSDEPVGLGYNDAG